MHASVQALYENLGRASRKTSEDVFASLTAEQALESADIVKALAASLSQDPGRWVAMQQDFYRRHFELWAALTQAPQTMPAAQTPVPPQDDRRFHAPEWQQLPYFNYLKQSYLLNSRWLAQMVETADLEPRVKQKLRFFTRQMIDAAAPVNFPATNPQVIKLATETKGESLLRGIELLNEDLKKGRISMTDETAFEVGRNIAVTPGTVVYANELFELIQYQPLTDTVYERPLLMVPPCINKYYILDLQPANSFVRYAVSQGHTVFMVSWRNVPADMGHLTWDQYVGDGVIGAIDAAREICGVENINALGFCVGGTLLGSALAVLSARQPKAVSSVTLLTTMLDFSEPGELAVFIDEAYVRQREAEFARGGVLRGKQLALTFSSLRANDLIWSYVVNSYLKGIRPDAFDLLYWNSDSTNLPGAMFVYYVRNTYLENNLRVAGKLTMCGVPVDLSAIEAPAYVLAAREDHIVPWHAAYRSAQLLRGDREFVLAASGHIAGVVNPVSRNKRHFWVSDSLPPTGDEWLAGARQQPGSWWAHWSDWLAGHSGASVAARARAGSVQHPPREPAPGRYVRERCD